MDAATEDGQEFRRLCREGMLFEVQEWIRSGKALPMDGDCNEFPLVLAAGKGFHSLVKLLVDQGLAQSQEVLDVAFAAAVIGGNGETAKLLLQFGATPTKIDNRALFQCPNVEILGLCIEAGVDLSTGTPLAIELINDSKAALRFLERWHDESEAVKDQGAMALIHAVRRAEEHLVLRLLRAGADPRRRVPKLGDRYEIGYPGTALEQGAHDGPFKILLLLGVRKSDDLRALMKEACWNCDMAIIKHLIQRGGKLNDKDEDGASALQECLHTMGLCRHLHFHARANKAWDAVVELAEMGARWIPDRDDLRDVRCGLRHASRDQWIEFAALMQRTKAADHATLAKLFGSRKMREQLQTYGKGDMEQVLGPKWWQPQRGRRMALSMM